MNKSEVTMSPCGWWTVFDWNGFFNRKWPFRLDGKDFGEGAKLERNKVGKQISWKKRESNGFILAMKDKMS